MNGYISLFRKFVSWEWYKNQNTKSVFIHCLLKANWEDGNYEGQMIKRGSFVTGRKKMSEELGLSEQQIRTALKHLISTKEITINKTNKYSIITITNYEQYQKTIQETNQQLTNNQPTTNQQLTTNEKEKEEKEYKKENIKRKKFEKPTIEKIKQYCTERRNSINAEAFYNFYESKDWCVGKNKMKNWKACVRTWEQRQNGNKLNTEELPKWWNKKNEDFEEQISEDERREIEAIKNGTYRP